MSKTIVLLASGTRGDVQPLVALALGLRAAGLQAVLATHAEFQPLADAHALPFRLLDGNPSAWMTRAGGQAALTYDGDLLRNLRATRDYWRSVQPLMRRLLDSAATAAAGADVIVAGLATTWGAHLAEALGALDVWAFLQPVARTRVFPSALLPFRFSLGPAYNTLTHRLVEQALWQPWRGLLNEWRRRLGLRPAPRLGWTPAWERAGARVMVGVSRQVLPRPADWPAGHHLTGYWFLEAPDPEPPAGLERFLASGPAVSISFGSPGVRAASRMLALVRQALDQAGLRAVVAIPAEAERPPESAAYFPLTASVAHRWLFPRVAAAAHHGGAGTTAASLRAGTPTLILPLAIDQFFWGERVSALGAGPRPRPQRALTAPALAQALRQAVDDAAVRVNAQALGAAIRAEDGVARATALIRAWV